MSPLLFTSLLSVTLMSGCASEQGRSEGGSHAGAGPRVETVARGLEAPWEIAFLPDGRALVTERPGRVRLLAADGMLRGQPIASVDVRATGEGGLLGLAVDPDFASNRFVYLYRTTATGNEVVRYRLEGARLVEQQVIVAGIPAGLVHNGGRIRFGPDHRLYASTGDAGNARFAQDASSLAGKFLSMSADLYRGSGGHPEVYSLGHRNPQGFDWEPGSGRLFASEHGASANDELNVIERGRNYGWPVAQGEDHGRYAAPLRVYDRMTVAPSGASFVTRAGSAWSGSLLIAGLRGEQLRRVRVSGDEVIVDEPVLDGGYGRLRAVVEGPDGALYVLTNNRDGRGDPGEGDDRILRVHPPRR